LSQCASYDDARGGVQVQVVPLVDILLQLHPSFNCCSFSISLLFPPPDLLSLAWVRRDPVS
jgi:hypothetical protein